LINSFGNNETEDIFHLRHTKASRKLLPVALHGIAKRKLNMIAVASQLIDLRIPPANRLEALKGSRAGFYSIRINDQYRIIFRWTNSGADDVEILDYH
jgi:proteic killer suppression protein